MTNLTNKVALVTGGSRGIGAAIAQRLAEDRAQVTITYAKSKDRAEQVVSAIEATGGRALALHADSADARQLAAAVEQAARTFGSLDIPVNNAGGGIFGPIDQLALNDIEWMIDLNIRGVVASIREALK